MTKLIEINGLKKSYSKSEFALKNVNFSLETGEIMGFIGENGAGKTTTLGCILGTLIKSSGNIKLFGQDATDENSYLRDSIGVFFDVESFGPRMTPKKIASVMRTVYTDWDDNLYQEYLKNFKLSYKAKIVTFSRGMTMKLALAVALSHHPKLLILDEVTGGLDPIVRDEVLDIILDFVSDGHKSVLFSSHITSDLEKIADTITFIHDGEIILSKAKDVLTYEYGILRCPISKFSDIDKYDVVAYKKRDFQIDVLVHNKSVVEKKYKDLIMDKATIEEIMLIIIRGESQ